jgi:hypothetical protein
MTGDFAEHNAEQDAVWEAFRAGRPIRAPVWVESNPRMVLLDPALNPDGVTFEQYTLDADVMLAVQIRYLHWERHALRYDHEMGLPAEGWDVRVDFQNFYEAAWLGAPVEFPENNCPYAAPLLDDDNKRMLFDRGIPDPFDDPSGWMRRNWEYVSRFEARREAGDPFFDRPIRSVWPSGLATDGPFTLATELRGEGACLDLVLDPDYLHELLEFITEATIQRVHAYRRRLGQPEKVDDLNYADDSIAMLSVEQFRDHVLPYHRWLVEALWTGRGMLKVHLCGDASRHFVTLRDELGVTAFDTGFPIDLHAMREVLGPDVLLQGGPRVQLLRDGPIREIEAATRELLAGPVNNGRFMLRDANNLAPRTPPEHIAAMYETARDYRYD